MKRRRKLRRAELRKLRIMLGKRGDSEQQWAAHRRRKPFIIVEETQDGQD